MAGYNRGNPFFPNLPNVQLLQPQDEEPRFNRNIPPIQRNPTNPQRNTNQRRRGGPNPDHRQALNQRANPNPSHQRRDNSNTRGGNRGQRGGNNNYRGNNNRRFRENDGREENASNNFRRPTMGFRALQSLLEKDSEEIILDLSNSRRGVSELLQSNLSDDAIILFIQVLRKVLDSSFEENKYKVIQKYFDGPFFETLLKYVTQLPLQDFRQKQKNKFFWEDPDTFWNNLIKISEEILNGIPSFARKVLPKLLKSLTLYIPIFEEEHSQHISDEIKDNVKKLFDAVEVIVKEYEEKEKKQIEEKLRNMNDEEEPPDDFREISVYPHSHELLGQKGFLRQNVIKGPYRDVNHYLDVQFRLLREDFVGPLRAGIESFRSGSKKKIENVKIHRRIRFLNPETVNENYCIRLKFDFSNKKKKFSYENSRRFMYGSLLCFTMDNFKSFIFGKVAERKVEILEKGELIVGFDQNTTVFYNLDYIMVECNVFFEPYFHVLNVLKHMSVDNFPMEKYIIHVDSTVEPPDYLLAPDLRYTIGVHDFDPLMQWPHRNFYDLNESQLRAFKAAITQEFTIIQGPPGTGKTFLGLKIAKTLLDNKKLWHHKTPMLVICYTNHALDQFLEGILACTNSIMRVGGQCKNEKLQSYNLRNRSRFKMSPAAYQQREEVQRIVTLIKNINENLKQIDLYDSVRSFEVFEDVVPNFTKTWFYGAKSDEILKWLLERRVNTMFTNASSARNNHQQVENVDSDSSDDEENDSDEYSTANSDEDLAFEDDDIFKQVLINVQCSRPLTTVKSMYNQIIYYENYLFRLKEKWAREPPVFEELLEEEKYTRELMKCRDDYEYLTMRLMLGKQNQSLEENPQHIDLSNPQNMIPDDRWRLYFQWLKMYKKKLQEKLDALNNQFREAFKIYEEIRDIEDSNKMKDVLVIGMTTTGAARLRSTLQTLKSPIVIVEEAAEVLEAHIITSLTKHCKHLILIGDHQQLKPSTADYRVETRFNLGISLFERMVLNKIQCYTLNVQHRMRPEIADLIRPTIYPVLEDHPSVNERRPILGIDNNMYFIDHSNKEEDCEGTSKKNYHEVKFLIYLAKHLVLNGYEPENITILAAYLGQMFEFQKEKKKHKHILDNMRIAVLDNYQGEECDIILLSLVRNNAENKIGFLSIENRVCVALSRARDGLYVMGNMTQLCNKSELWREIKITFENKNAIGPSLPLRCQVHRETVTYVKIETDFMGVPEGGCNKKCEAPLACGHNCLSMCHILDREHKKYQCIQTCRKKLCDEDDTHICLKPCYKECGPCNYLVKRKLACDHEVNIACSVDPDKYPCTEPVSTKLPCDHIADKPCHVDTNNFKCPHPCETKVEPCGHACVMRCHVRKDPDHLEYKCRKPCAKYRKGCTVETKEHLCPNYCYEDCPDCKIVVRKERTVCPHRYDVACNEDVDLLTCKRPCTKILSCGHKCKSNCCEPCGKCQVKVAKTLPKCGHVVKTKCCDEPDRKLCTKKCPLLLPCGHPCTARCNQACTERCTVMVDCGVKAPCGHVVTRLECSVVNRIGQLEPGSLLKRCDRPCGDQLKCGHPCSGSCGECFQGRVHKRCKEKCSVPLVCDHPCEFPCRQACRPCRRPCPYRCQHSRCRKRCGEVCTPCTENCARRCEHQSCGRFCGEICDVPPCEEPCKKLLKCGHPCVGFCGDPCPPKCLICHNEELTEIFFGFEGDDARYVLLNDCGHILESTGLEHWLKQNENEISFKVCPKCKTAIKTTQRFSDDIKAAMADVAKVKEKSSGTPKENEEKRAELKQQLQILRASSGLLGLFVRRLPEFFDKIDQRLKESHKGNRQFINKHELNAITSKLQITEHVIKMCCKNNTCSDSKEIYFPQVKLILKTLLREEDHITDQEIDDLNLELNRLSRIVEFSKIKKSPYYLSHFTSKENIRGTVALIEKLLFGFERFYDQDEEKVRGLLESLSKSVASGIGISDKERREIVAAMGFTKGHWYKCPNGHPYAIGECGGAMQESKCNECGARIGGTNHSLIRGNAVATEMDGATYGAWSEAANLANYNLRDLM